jgi:hypothetical protein
MQAAEVRRAVVAAMSTASALDLAVDDAVGDAPPPGA